LSAMYGLLDISEKEFQDISRLVHGRFGINLTDKKVTLVKGRLNKLIRERGYTSFSQYYKAVMEDTTGAELLGLVDKISTNHTYFFRENDHFQILRESILPETLASIPGGDVWELKIWCAGCSSGEEAYTLAIELLDFSRALGSSLAGRIILATDISLSALEAAAKGDYVAERVRGVSREHLSRYFTLTPAGTYRVKESLRSLILFKRLNLMRESFPFKGKFHMIFCRNVMIYFDKPTKDRLVEHFSDLLYPGGHLFIGHSESLGRDLATFEYRQPALYRKRGI